MERSAHQVVRLRQFIRDEQESILEEFEEFARTNCRAGHTMNPEELRDHLAGLLSTIALDMERDQSDGARERKSEWKDLRDGAAAESAAESYGTDRAEGGFTLAEMCSEYRALRASVLRLWTKRHGVLDGDADDVVRFNEALDTALAESIRRFAVERDRSREMFLAILGHDLRTPLSAIVSASSFLSTEGGLSGRSLRLAERIHSSGRRMNDLVSNLVDITRGHLGKGMPVSPVEMDLAEIGRGAVDEIRSVTPTSEVRFASSGDLRGEWDPCRVSQALSNLIANAVQHGAESTPIVVTARGEADEVVVCVHNHGRVIEPEDQDLIFDAFERIASAESELPRMRSSGLGLYIAKQIALAHGGSIGVHSTMEEGTTFELRLPRRVPV